MGCRIGAAALDKRTREKLQDHQGRIEANERNDCEPNGGSTIALFVAIEKAARNAFAARDMKARRSPAPPPGHDLIPERVGHHKQHEPGVAFEEQDGASKLVHTTGFDYGLVDRLLAGAEDDESFDLHAERDIFMLFGSMWGEVLEWVYVPKNPRLIGLRVLAVIYFCRPAMLDGATLEKIAATGDITKSTFQDLTAKFRDHFKVVCRSMRKESSRRSMRVAALRLHAQKKLRK